MLCAPRRANPEGVALLQSPSVFKFESGGGSMPWVLAHLTVTQLVDISHSMQDLTSRKGDLGSLTNCDDASVLLEA